MSFAPPRPKMSIFPIFWKNLKVEPKNKHSHGKPVFLAELLSGQPSRSIFFQKSYDQITVRASKKKSRFWAKKRNFI